MESSLPDNLSYCPFLVSSTHIRERQLQCLRRLRFELEDLNSFSMQLLESTAISIFLSTSLSSAEWRKHLPNQINDQQIFDFPRSSIWKQFILKEQVAIKCLITHLTLFQPSLLLFIIDLALAITSILSRRHFDVEEWAFERQVSDAPLISIPLKTSNLQTTMYSNQDVILIGSNIKNRTNVQFIDTLHIAKPFYSIQISNNRIDIPPLPPKIPSQRHLRKWHIAHLLAASIMGLICPDQTGNCDISGYRRFGNIYTFSGWFFESRGVRVEKIKCLVIYFSMLRDLCPNNSAIELRHHIKMNEIVTIERAVGPKIFSGSGDIVLKEHTTNIVTHKFENAVTTRELFEEKDGEISESWEDVVSRWRRSTCPLQPVEVVNQNIEDCDNCLRADFANKRLGGGTLKGGMVQEEILFSIFPELLPLILLCPQLDANEAFVLYGVERYVEYKGYSNKFKCLGPVTANLGNRSFDSSGFSQNQGPLSESGFLNDNQLSCLSPQGGRIGTVSLDITGLRRNVSIAVIDALNVSRNVAAQYSERAVIREIMKCSTVLSGISLPVCSSFLLLFTVNLNFPLEEHEKVVFATGNWLVEACLVITSIPAVIYKRSAGSYIFVTHCSIFNRVVFIARGCGAFRGDPQLKFLIQWIAASEAGRSIMYCPFGDVRVTQLPFYVTQVAKIKTVGNLFELLCLSLRKWSGNNSIWDITLKLLSSEYLDDPKEKNRGSV